jgi:hypothetical protein
MLVNFHGRFLALCSLMLVACVSFPLAQAEQAGPGSVQVAQPVATTPKAVQHTSDAPDLLRETQQTASEAGHSGLIWWIPFEFWIESGLKRGTSAEQTTKTLSALKDYTVVLVFAAEVSPLGSFTFVPPGELQKKVVVRDASGVEYAAILDPSQDAKTLAAAIKPVLGNALGKAGESSELLFFPAKRKDGRNIADAAAKGSFSIVLKDILGVPESVYVWRTPLTSVAAPVFCPIGKERMHADWEYCPWHGAKLNEQPKP